MPVIARRAADRAARAQAVGLRPHFAHTMLGVGRLGDEEAVHLQELRETLSNFVAVFDQENFSAPTKRSKPEP